MELLVDIGNTNLKWTLGAPRAGIPLEPMRTLRHHGGLPIDLLASWEALEGPGRVRVSSVAATALTDALCRAIWAFWGLQPEVVRPHAQCQGLRIAYEDPSRLGVDRWLALLAARQLVAAPVLVLDAGTAITFDLLLADGRHLGGLILPGVETMRQALLANTQIPAVTPAEVDDSWASDTATAIAVASLDSPVALAERLLRKLAAEAGAEPVLIVTGGDAERLKSRLQVPALLVPDLVLQGLVLAPD
jgi:type III pantothenate kinase